MKKESSQVLGSVGAVLGAVAGPVVFRLVGPDIFKNRTVDLVILLWLLICPTIGGLIITAKSRDPNYTSGPIQLRRHKQKFRIYRISFGVIIGLLLGPLGWMIALSTPTGAFWACPACLKWVPTQATKCCHCGNTLDYAWRPFDIRCPYCAHGSLVYTLTGRDNFAHVNDAAKCEGCGSTGVVILKRGGRPDIRWNEKAKEPEPPVGRKSWEHN